MYATINAFGTAAGTVSADPAGMLASQRTAAVRQRELLLRTAPRFSRMPKFLKTEVLAGILVELIRLAGRARRSSTPVELYLVGNADGGSPARRTAAHSPTPAALSKLPSSSPVSTKSSASTSPLSEWPLAPVLRTPFSR